MKINRIFTAAMAAMFMLSACTNENEKGSKTGSGDETYAGVSITIPSTRAYGDINASNEECVITSVGVYIVDQTTNAIHSAVLGAGDFTQSGTDGKVTATTAVKTVTGTKNIYVITNPTANLISTIDAQRNLAFKNILSLDETSYYTGTNTALTNMVMTGYKIGHDMTTVVKEANAFDAGKVLPITVQRNTSRVVLKEKTGGITVDGGTASDIQFAMIAKNQKSYISEIMTVSPSGTPYFDVPNSATTNSADPYFNNFSTITPLAADYLPIVAAATPVPDAKGFYVLENKTNNKRVGNTTAVRIKLKYTPTTAKGSKIISSWAAGVATEGSLLADGTFYIYTGGDNSYWTKAAHDAAIAAGPDQIPATDFSAEYTNGIGYYKIYIAATEDGEKCVLRNNYYELTLARIKGPGQPVPPEEPKDPVEDDTWLGIELNMLPWTWSPTEWTVQ